MENKQTNKQTNKQQNIKIKNNYLTKLTIHSRQTDRITHVHTDAAERLTPATFVGVTTIEGQSTASEVKTNGSIEMVYYYY